MNRNYSFGTRALAFLLSLIMVLGMFPRITVAADGNYVAEVNGEQYETLEAALEAVPAGQDAPETTITLLQNVTYAFDIGTEDGSAPKKIVLDLGGYDLHLGPAVGSAGTRSSGIRVLAWSKLTVKNGRIFCKDGEADNIKVGIANYGDLVLDSVILSPGAQTIYSINNRGKLTLRNSTRIENGTGSLFRFGITNDPYEYIYSDKDAVVNCDSGSVYVGSMQVERYSRATTNAGGVVLNITAGTFGRIVEDGNTAVEATYNISGGTIGASTAADLENALKIVSGNSTIKLLDDVTLGFDVGVEDGSLSRNITLDLGGKTLTTAPAVGSAGTKTSGIRVLARSALTLKNGTVSTPDETDDVKIKVGIANYGVLDLESVHVKAGNAIIYTINNRGSLTLRGNTTVDNGNGGNFKFAITNDPYEYIYTNTNATLKADDSAVKVGKVQLERYERATTNAGGIELSISAGTFESVTTDGGSFVQLMGGITGGVFGNDVSAFVDKGYRCVQMENGSYQVEFVKLQQDALVFENPAPEALTYGVDASFTNTASGGSTDGKITYALVTEDCDPVDCVTVDENTGLVTILKAGVCKIRATMAGNDIYEPASAEYVLTIMRSDREASFEQSSLNVFYGTASIEAPALSISAGTGAVTYQVIEGAEIAAVDAETGMLTFADGGLGKVVVRATVAADENYNSCVAEFTVNVAAAEAPETPYEASGEKGNNGWFLGDMTITAPEGYTMSKTNSFGGEWVKSFTYTEEGAYEDTIYLKDKDGLITVPVTVEIKIDKTAPSALSITFSEADWIDTVKRIFGYGQQMEVTFTFKEEVSGPEKVEFSLDNGVSWKSAVFGNNAYTASVDPQYRGNIQMRVTDQAGLTAVLDNDGRLLVVDSVAPGVSVTHDDNCDKSEDESGKLFFVTSADSFKICITVSDENLDLQEANPTLTIKDENNEVVEMDVIWKDVELEGKFGKQAELIMTEEKTYNIHMTCSDRTNQKEVDVQVIVDRSIPDLAVLKDTKDGIAPVRTINGVSYYNAGTVAFDLHIMKSNFKSSRAGVEITYNGDLINPFYYGYYGISLDNQWDTDGYNPLKEAVYLKNLSFSERAREGEYTVKITYTQGMGQNQKVSESAVCRFVIDRSNPQIKIAYAEDGNDLIKGLEKFLFGKVKVDVTITATDSISDIYQMVYATGDGAEHTVEADALRNGSYTFSISEEYRNCISAKAYDLADNATEMGQGNTIIIDKTPASISISATAGEGGSYTMTETNGIKNYLTASESFCLIFSIEHQNYDARAVEPVIEYRAKGTGDLGWTKVNENCLTRSFDEAEPTKGTIVVSLPSDVIDKKMDDYEFRCTYTLFDGWDYSDSAIAYVSYDALEPTVETEYDTNAVKSQENGVYVFQTEQKVTIKVTEKHFAESDVKVDIKYQENINSEPVEWSEMPNLKWSHMMNDVHVLSMMFREEGIYTLSVTCTDTLENHATQNIHEQRFVIDYTAPTIQPVEYPDSVDSDTILDVFYRFFNLQKTNGKITAVVKAEDIVSGMAALEVSVDGKPLEKVVNNHNGTYSVEISEDLRGKLTVYAADKAQREETLYEQSAMVVDSVAPDVNATYPAAGIHEYNGIVYTASAEFPIVFRVTDENYDLRAADAVVKIGESIQTLTWTDLTNAVGAEAVLPLTEQGLYEISAAFSDRSQNSDQWNQTFVLDRDKPEIRVSFEDGQIQNQKADVAYYQTAQTVSITITETNFLPELVELKLVDGKGNELYKDYAKDAKNWSSSNGEHTLTLEVQDDDDYELMVDCVDLAGNAAESYMADFVVDQTLPELGEITYDQKASEVILEGLTFGFFKAPVHVSVTASDNTAGVKSISYKVEGTRGTSDQTAVVDENTMEPDGSGKITFALPDVFCGTITVSALDYANNESSRANVDFDEQKLDTIVVDGEVSKRTVTIDPNPVRIVAVEDMTDSTSFAEGEAKVLYFNSSATMLIEVTEENFFAENYVVSINGVEQTDLEWSSTDTKHTAPLTLRYDGDYVVEVSGKDYSGNLMEAYTSQRIVVDQTQPSVSVEFHEYDENNENELVKLENFADGTYCDGAVVARVTIQEHNFRPDEVKLLVTAKNAANHDVLPVEGGYVKSYLDQGKTQNVGTEDADKWSAYTTDDWRREGDAYVIDLIFNASASYDFRIQYEDLAKNPLEEEYEIGFVVDNDDPIITVEGMSEPYITEAEHTVLFHIIEQNFIPEQVNFMVNAVNAKGENVDLAEGVMNAQWESNADKSIWTLKLVLQDEANYTFELSYADPSGRKGFVAGTNDTTYKGAITLDHTAPENVSIVCCNETICYHEESAVLNLEATDVTAGMMAFEITMMPDGNFDAANDWDVKGDKPWKITVPCDVDLLNLNERLLANNLKVRFAAYSENEPVYADGTMRLKMTVYPGFHGVIGLKAIDMAKNFKDAAPAAIVVDDIAPVLDVTMPTANTTEDKVLYYSDKSVKVQMTMTEANFYEEDPIFKVNGEEVALDWNGNTAEYELREEGHYFLTMEYTDRSGNPMVPYTSKEIVLDRSAPVIDVTYDLMTPVSVHEGRQYFDAVRTATVKVTEENFVPDDVDFTLSAKSLVGANVSGPVVSGWTSKDNVHTCVLTYSADANYTFDLNYADKAGNQAVYGKDRAADYKEDQFTVDRTVPGKISISYSESARQTVLNNIFFYDAQVDVTLTCEDVTAGVDEFVYSYVNGSLKNETVAATRKGDSATFTATFQIPKSALNKNNQFNDSVNVAAIDRSGNRTTEQSDGKRIVVDNISPVAVITYNDPVQTVDGTAYYSDKISASIQITEANFDSKDVKVTVTRDGEQYTVTPEWSDQSRDVHTGKFTLDQSGDYIVSVMYTDKSNNAMASYTSGKMVIDQAAPTIVVSDVVADSANDEDVYSFTITVEDADGNLLAKDIQPVLSAVVRDENGNHTVTEIDLGDVKVVAAGKTYVYTVENLPKDGIYTLSCSAKDLALNTTNVMVLDDGQTYEQVRFSINRNGSTFIYGNKETEQLAQQYYVKQVDHDVVIHEINVDPIEQYTVTLNGVELKEGEGFTTSIQGGGDKWCLREYVISSEHFAAEGEYNIVLSSVDATNATAFSDLKGLRMTFVVDRTAPSVVVGGLEDAGRYEGVGQEVTILPSDDGGSLSSVTIKIYENGADIEKDEPIAILEDLRGAELIEYLDANDGQIRFTIPEGYRQTVVIVCEDEAIGEDGVANVYTRVFENVTVSSDRLVIFFANKPLFYGTICGSAALLMFVLLFFKRKKKEDEDTKA